VALSLIVPFLLLSASHEGLFILALILNMFCWLLLELHSADSGKNKVMSQGPFYCMCFEWLPHLSENTNYKCLGKLETDGPNKGKGKLQALTGPDGSRRLRLPDYMTIGI
jgi:hypothetical protein